MFLIISFFGLAMAAVKTPETYTNNRSRYGADETVREMKCYTIPDGYVTSAKNDTVLIADGASTLLMYGDLITYYCNFRGNAGVGVDSGDVKIYLEVGTDSVYYYVPVPDTVIQYDKSLAADTLASGIAGVTNIYKSYCQTLNDSTYSYQLYTIQPKVAAAGRPLALRISAPNGIEAKRLRLIHTADTKFQASLDTTFLEKRQLQIRRPKQR